METLEIYESMKFHILQSIMMGHQTKTSHQGTTEFTASGLKCLRTQLQRFRIQFPFGGEPRILDVSPRIQAGGSEKPAGELP